MNNFHKDIKFTYETESDSTISFLDVNVTRRSDGTFDTAVYRKKTDNSIYINWDAFATRQWKIGTLKGLFRRAFLICSTKEALEKEIKFLKDVFTKNNGYPSKIVNRTLEEIRNKVKEQDSSEEKVQQPNGGTPENEEDTKLMPYCCLPYKGTTGEKILRGFKRKLQEVLPSNVEPRFTYKGTKLGSLFTIKDKVESIHQTNLVYGYIPQGESELKDGYIGETHVRLGRRTQEHGSWDKKSSIYKNSLLKNIEVAHDDFKILERGYPRYIDRKIAESLYVKDYNPVLNEQQDSYRLKLFN